MLVIVAVAGWACGPAEVGDLVRVGTDVDAETLDPRLMRNTTAYRVTNLLYDGLVRLDTMLEPVPTLAERWEHPDSLTWIFHLREARFHDGTPVTAADVRYTFETILDPATRSPSRTLYTPIRRVEAVAPRTVRFELHHPFAPFLSYLDIGIVPRHVVESGADLGRRPIGSGPYRLRDWNVGSRLRLEANTEYWAGPPSVARVDVVIVPDNTARAQAFEAGNLDLIQSPLAPRDVGRLAADERFNGTVRPGLAITYLNFNTRRTHLRDARMRRALASLIDQRVIVDEIYEKTDVAAGSIFPPTSWAHDPAIVQPDFDPSRAVRLFSELGWRDTDGDGMLDRDGRPLRVSLGTHSEDINRVQTIEFLQHTFTRHGVTVDLWISDWPSFSARRDAGDYDVILLGWTQILDPDRVTFEQLHSMGGLNWGGYGDEALDRALERGRSTLTRAERRSAYIDAARIVAQALPYYILSYQGYQIFLSSRLTGFTPNPRGMLRSLTTARVSR